MKKTPTVQGAKCQCKAQQIIRADGCKELPLNDDVEPLAIIPPDLLAERHIRKAQERGEFDDLPGAGAPLTLDDDVLVLEEQS